MNTRRITNLFLLLLLLTLNACGGGSGSSTEGDTVVTEYYVDATDGSDNNNGLATTTAWKTLNKIAISSFNSTAKIFLKRGETWNESLILPGNDITLDAYGAGASPKIDGSKAISNWSNIGSGIYSANVILDAGQGFGNLSENNIMLSFIPWDNDVGTTFTAAAAGSFSFDYLLNTLYIKPATDPSLNSYLASIQLRGIYAKDRSNILIRNINVSRVSLNGIEFYNCVNCNVSDSTVTRVGGAVIAPNFIASPDFIHAGNGIDYSNSCSNSLVNNVTVSEIFDSCLAVELYLNNNNASSIALSNSQLSQCGFAGVEISVQSNQGVNTNSHLDGVTVSSINIDKAGKGWSGRRYGTEGHGLRIVVDNGAGTMKNISVSSTQASDSAGDGIKLAGEINTVTLQGMRLTKNDGVGINVAEPMAATLRLDLNTTIVDKNLGYGLSYNAPSAAGLKIYHNTFYDNGAINLAVFNQAGVADIRNNIFNSSAAMTHVFVNSTLTGATLNNNCYNDTTNMFGYNGSAYSTVVSFFNVTNFEDLGIGDVPVALNNPNSGDFTLATSSSCRNRGANGIGITTDYLNKSYAIPPASGAFAYAP